MKRNIIFIALTGFILIALQSFAGGGSNANMADPFVHEPAMVQADSLDPIKYRNGNFLTGKKSNPFDLDDPPAMEQKVEYDPASGLYILTESLGGMYLRAPTYMTFDEYMEWKADAQQSEYFSEIRKAADPTLNSKDPITKYDIKNDLIDRLFGGNQVSIKPNGNVDITLGADYQKVDNPILTERQRLQGGFDFDMAIRMNVVGQIGEKLKLSTNYNTQAIFDVDNQQLKLGYSGEEDDIIKRIEGGNVSLPLKSSLIQGSQSLFGIKTKLQFGRLTLTSVLSQQKSKRQNIQIQGGTQLQEFEVEADKYDENRHFFLSHYNRNSYERALRDLPKINTLFRITKIEVWVTNTRNATEGVRDIVALSDLGEGERGFITNKTPAMQPPIIPYAKDLFGRPLPDNAANPMYQELVADDATRVLDNTVSNLQGAPYNLEPIRDFQQVRARLLSPNDYSYHAELGYLSLNVTPQTDHVVGVSFEYTYNGETYRVGEFAQDLPINQNSTRTLGVLYTKMLKSSNVRIDLPLWDLMMKNVYSLNAFQVNSEDFKLDIFYQDPGGGEKRSLPEGTGITGVPLISLLNLDNLNSFNDPQPDGIFDFVPGVTINPQNGRIIFPVLEPFGSSLYNQFDTINERNIARNYVYQQLYDSTITIARQYPEFNRYIIRGRYKSSFSSEIALGGFNIPRGSVTVTAGGQKLTEGVDYDVDYNIGKIRVINESLLNSGVPISVSYEDNTLFGFQTKTMLGTRADYWINDNFTMGATFLRLTERPFTQKVNIGDDPIANNIYGFDINYSQDAPWLTRLVDKLPLYDTKEKSTFAFTGEVAYLDPGSSNAIKQDKESQAYIDDFEGSESSYDLRTPTTAWVIASTPQTNEFPEADSISNLDYGKNRALLNWYRIDNQVRGAGPSNSYTRQVRQQDVFPNLQLASGQINVIQTFDLHYYPDKRGPYNFDVNPVPGVTAGVDSDNDLREPDTRWGGIMRSLNTNDFEASNVEFIEFWMMSPFLNGSPNDGTGGELYLNLGNISEDILRDSRKFFENGLPKPGSDTRADTVTWGRIPRTQAITNAFDNDPDVRLAQDVGLDGLSDAQEREHFDTYLADLQAKGLTQDALNAVNADPSNDNFAYYNDQAFNDNSSNVYERYLKYNNQEGNSQPPAGNQLSASTNLPDSEDLNRDNSLTQSESFFEYKIPIKSDGAMGIRGNNFITDSTTQNNEVWYQFRIPIDQYTSKHGGIQDFRSIQFVRMYLKGWNTPVVMRFARLELVRNQWRRYTRSLINPGPIVVTDPDDGTIFDVGTVNIEENGNRAPFRYVLPPGIQREQSLGQFADALQNEQSLSMKVCNLKDGDARAIYKIVNLDMRTFKRLKMFVHAEAVNLEDQYEPGKVAIFMRLGSDFERNYYEYEIPLTLTDRDIIGTGDDALYAAEVWLDENEFDFPLDLLREVKIQRNANASNIQTAYEINDPEKPNNKVRVVGNPDIGYAKSIMIGVRNIEDDALPVCAELWVNELRMSGFDERGGFAGLARLDMRMADLGNLTVSGNYQSIGWGAIDQKLAQRSKEEVIQWDASSNLEFGKFFPKNWGVKIPVYGQISERISNPEFDPYDFDIPLKSKLNSIGDKAQKDSIRRRAQDYQSIKSINVTNVRIEGPSKNENKFTAPWATKNFTLSYGYTRKENRDPTIEQELDRDHRGSVGYAYSPGLKPISPFKRLVPKKGKYWAFLRDFSVNLLPNTFSFNTGIQRKIGSVTYRFGIPGNNTYYNKRFSWDRSYNTNWNLTKSLSLNFSAQNQAIIDEPDGLIDTQVKKDSVWSNVRKFGRTQNYSHNFTARYTLPFNKFPILDWINSNATYTGNYSWTGASILADSLGNTIANRQSRRASATLDFTKLYNKSKFLKKVNQKKRKTRTNQRNNNNSGRQAPEPDEKQAKAKKKKNKGEPSTAARVLLRPLMLIRRARLNYTEDFSSTIPGYMPNSRLFGQATQFSSPGWDFVAGWQPGDTWLDDAAGEGWITDNIFLNQQVLQTYSQNIDGAITLEPFADFKIDVTAKRNFRENHNEYFKVADPNIGFEHLTPIDVGSLTMSYNTINTFFQPLDANNVSPLFEQFEANRSVISNRLGTGTHIQDGPNYTDGYGRYQQDVLIPAFIAAYSKIDASSVKLDVFDLIPLPNWTINYNGLAKLPFMKNWVRNFRIKHNYRSTLTVNQFRTDLDYDSGNPSNTNENTDNFFAKFEIPDMVIQEGMSPVIGIDLELKNGLNANFDYKKTRNLGMSFIDYQLSETRTSEVTVGAGYRIKNVKFPFKIGPEKKSIKNDLNLKFDFSLRDDVTINHLLDQAVSEPTRGVRSIRISPSADYKINKNLSTRFFVDYSKTIPKTSAAFPITSVQGGLTVQFRLTQ